MARSNKKERDPKSSVVSTERTGRNATLIKSSLPESSVICKLQSISHDGTSTKRPFDPSAKPQQSNKRERSSRKGLRENQSTSHTGTALENTEGGSNANYVYTDVGQMAVDFASTLAWLISKGVSISVLRNVLNDMHKYDDSTPHYSGKQSQSYNPIIWYKPSSSTHNWSQSSQRRSFHCLAGMLAIPDSLFRRSKQPIDSILSRRLCYVRAL
jgi:hypothetical protein